jgi:hypothetical protein
MYPVKRVAPYFYSFFPFFPFPEVGVSTREGGGRERRGARFLIKGRRKRRRKRKGRRGGPKR